MCAEDKVLGQADFGGVPAHARALSHAKEVAAGFIEQHFGSDGYLTLGANAACAGGFDMAGSAQDGFQIRGGGCQVHHGLSF
jgi:hypothetical protein